MCGNGGAGDGEDSGLSSWLVRVCACVTGKPVVSGLDGV